MTHEIDSEAAMLDLGAAVGEKIAPGSILALVGRLGAGKTHFAKGVVRGLGGDEAQVTSPTFTLAHEYSDRMRLPVSHFDFYRLDSADEVLRIGWDDYAEDGHGVLLVEWADKFPELLPAHTRWWRFEILENGRRRVTETAS